MSKILVIEDDTALGDGLRFDLEADSHEVILTSTARTALAAMKDHVFDLVMLDVNLPDGDGFDLIQDLKAYQNIPVIFLTARDQERDQIRGFSLGADDYITKPFSMALLRMRVDAVLRRNTSEVGAIGKPLHKGVRQGDLQRLATRDDLSLRNVESYWQWVLQGVIIIAVVLIHSRSQKRG